MLRPLTTQIVGSYAKPHWLARHDRMGTHDGSWWRPDAEVLREAREDAARLAIYDQERAGLDLITDGEAQRQDYHSHFYARFRGVDVDHRAHKPFVNEITTIRRRAETPEGVARKGLLPRVVGPVGWPGPLGLDELRLLKSHTNRPVKAMVVGPLTAINRTVDEYYGDEETAAIAMAVALNKEMRALDAEGVNLIQIDEPSFHAKLTQASRFGVAAINRMVEGVRAPVAVHVCYGYASGIEEKHASPTYAECLELLASCAIQAISIEYEQPGHGPDLLRHCGEKTVILGLLNLGMQEIETPEHIAARIRAALTVVPPERLSPSADCGMWHLPRSVAYGKIRSLVLGTDLVRNERGLE